MRARPCRFLSDIRGTVTVAAALALPVVIGAAGLAVDGGQLYVAKRALQNAVDAAALAGSMTLPDDPDMDKGLVTQAINTLMQKNYPEATVTNIQGGNGVRSVCVSAEAKVDMTLMKVLGVDEDTVTASSCAGFNYLEVALILDTTGSMGDPNQAGTPMSNVIQSAYQFVDLLMPEDGTPAVKVGVVPFQGLIRIGENGVDSYPAGCRKANGESTDGKIRDEYYNTTSYYKYEGKTWSQMSSAKRTEFQNKLKSLNSCDPEKLSAILPLKQERSDVTAYLDNLKVEDVDWLKHGSGTVIAEGVKWGRHVLTPEAPYTQGSTDKRYRKILILLTDGGSYDGAGTSANPCPNKFWCNSYFEMGLNSTYAGHTYAKPNDFGKYYAEQMLAEGDLTKAADIEVFTIYYYFSGSESSTDGGNLKKLATDDKHYFKGPTPEDIEKAFKYVGKAVGNRLMSKAEAGVE